MLKVVIFLSCTFILKFALCEYKANWRSLDSRPLPDWYDKSKFGIFIHWGVFSVPAFHSEWLWKYWHENLTSIVDYLAKLYPKDVKYSDFGPRFKAELFNATELVDVVLSSGAKYAVLTSKHHEGFTMWPSKYSWNWNAVDSGPGMDIVGEFATAIHKTRLKLGLYYSLFEWFHPLFLEDKKKFFTQSKYVDMVAAPQLQELVNTYKPHILWSDGDNGPVYYWRSRRFLAWLYNKSPVKDFVVTNDRWGSGALCQHGGFLTCEDRFHPGRRMQRKWESCVTLDRLSWGYRKEINLEDVIPVKELLMALLDTVSFGGNFLLNIAPRSDGKIPLIFKERLQQIGSWLKVNSEAIFDTEPWITPKEQNQSIWYTLKQNSTSQEKSLFVTFFDWPKDSQLILHHMTTNNLLKVEMLGINSTNFLNKTTSYSDKRSSNEEMIKKAKEKSEILIIDLTPIHFTMLPSFYAWCLKFQYKN